MPTRCWTRETKAAFKSRLDDLAHEIDNADAAGNPEKAEALRSERDALIRVRDGLAVFAEPGEVELDGLPHLVQDSFFGIGERDAARQVRAPCSVSAVVGTLDDDCVTGHGFSGQSCLSDASLGAWWQDGA